MRVTTRVAASAVCGALLLTAACGGEQQAPDRTRPSASPDRDSLFDNGVNIAVKFDQPGFNVQDDRTRNYAGFENDLANFLASELDLPDVVLNDEPSNRRERVLTNGTADLVIATYSITEDRERQIDFAGPYFETRQGVLVREDDSSITSRETLADKVVCTVSGSTSAPESPGRGTKKQLARLLPKTRVDYRENYSECVDQLRQGNFDAVWTDQAVLYGFMERYDDVTVVEGLELGSPQRYGIGIQEGREEDCEKLAGKLRLFLTSSRWHDSFTSHFPRLAEEDEGFEQRYKPDPADIDDYSCADD